MTVKGRLGFVLLAVAALPAMALLSAACGGGDDGGAGNGNSGGGGQALEMPMGDNFFELNGEKNPTLKVAPGAKVEINLKNDGTAIHNMRVAGGDNQFKTGDDAVSTSRRSWPARLRRWSSRRPTNQVSIPTSATFTPPT